jgi:outer membrane biogenesis lipoprotein LolB
MFKKFLFIIFLAILAIVVLTGCSSRFNKGDKLVAQENITVVEDYNNWQLPKCTIAKDAAVTVTGFSSISQGGGGDQQGIIELSSDGCNGWIADDASLNSKLK